MSSSSTATLPLPTATPHLRAVRSVPPVSSVPVAVPVGPGASGAAGPSVPPTPVSDRWHGAAARAPHVRPPHAGPPHVGPAHAGPARPTPAVPQPGAAVPQVPQALLAALPEGAAVVAALPQGVLPQGLLAQYGTQFGGLNGSPMVGYLVLVPTDSPVSGPAGLPGVPVAPAGTVVGTPPVSGAQPSTGGPGAQTVAGIRPARPAGRGISVDTERRNAYVDGRLLDLTYLEFELLAHLTEHPQRVHTRDHLVSAVWGYGHVGDGRTVDVHVARLRRKLGTAYRDTIVTVRRVGYKYTPATV
ncbi:winged helix-turn-helix domain-containing protein [Kitasatospora sp. NPDC056783]|uniref:winged helix-turn-helix domain-containing protein n=1 Tax=Kitasatospora sp. NPDC056783 TaxID=3345943 RepID=UPI0036BE9B34